MEGEASGQHRRSRTFASATFRAWHRKIYASDMLVLQDFSHGSGNKKNPRVSRARHVGFPWEPRPASLGQEVARLKSECAGQSMIFTKDGRQWGFDSLNTRGQLRRRPNNRKHLCGFFGGGVFGVALSLHHLSTA